LKRERSASGYQSLDNIKCQIGPKVLPHDPASFFTGAPPGISGQKNKIEKPHPSPAGPRKSLYAVFSARETSLVHPLKVDTKIREAHTMAVRLKPRMTILLKRRMLFASTSDGSNISRLNGSCLCVISQLPRCRATSRLWPVGGNRQLVARTRARRQALRIAPSIQEGADYVSADPPTGCSLIFVPSDY